MSDASPLAGWVGDVLNGATSRGLTAGEMAMVPAGLADALDLPRIRILDRAHNPFALGKVLVRGHDIYWKGAPTDISQRGIGLRSLLVHELCHIWQYATGRLSAVGYLTNAANWEYRYEVRDGDMFDDYGVEKQADLVQDWYRMREGHAPCHYRGDAAPTLAWLEATIPFARPPSLAG